MRDKDSRRDTISAALLLLAQLRMNRTQSSLERLDRLRSVAREGLNMRPHRPP